jgi:hypothetical protein
MTNDKYPLTWLKFFRTTSHRSHKFGSKVVGPNLTTYSKYGFISRTPKNDKNTQKHFESILNNVKLYFKKNPNKKKYMLSLFERRNTPLYDPEFKDPELRKIDLRGKWYMDWNSYKPFVEIIECSLSELKN